MQPKKSKITHQIGQLYQIAISDIKPDPEQPRKYFDPTSISELATSIKKHGVIQPILLRKDGSGEIILVAGERRLKAAIEANLTEMPALFTNGNPTEIALVENLLRENLTAIEEAEALQRVMDNGGYTQEDLGNIIGKSRNTVSEILSLTRLPQDIRDSIRTDPTYARRELVKVVAGKKKEKTIRSAFEKYRNRIEKRKSQDGKARPRSDKVEVLNRQLNEMAFRLDEIGDWHIEEKVRLQENLEALATIIKNLLAQVSLEK